MSNTRKLPSTGLLVVCVMLIAVISQLCVTSGDGQSGGDCKGCHSGREAGRLGLKDVYADIAGYKVSHEGVEKNCAGCHLSQKGLNAGAVRESGVSDYQTKAVFFLSGLSRDRLYVIALGFEDRAGRRTSSSFKFRPYEVVLSRESVDVESPSVSNVRVVSITKKIFLNAAVQWDADEPSAGFVEYGSFDGYTERVFFEDVFETRRSVNLPGLRSGIYRFRIISRDIFGNTSISGEYKLDSSKIYGEGREVKARNAGVPAGYPRPTPLGVGTPGWVGVGRAKPAARLFRLDSTGDVYVEILSALPVKASLKLTEEIEFGSHGTGLSQGRFSRIDACRACHPQDASHPVAIRSSGASAMAHGDMPTIEGGLITCVTCHYPHGGVADYFLRFDRESKLCEKCHKGAPF